MVSHKEEVFGFVLCYIADVNSGFLNFESHKHP